MKKIALLLVLSLCAFAACEKGEETPNGDNNPDNPPASNEERFR